MKVIGVGLLVIGLAVVFASCSLLPSEFGAERAAINPTGILGGIFGGVLALGGLALITGGDQIAE